METPSEADYASVRRAAEELQRRGWTRRWTLNEALHRWEDLVTAIERGYDLGIYDYTNDLSIRDWLEQVRPLLTDLVARSLDERLEPIDERFRRATSPESTRLSGTTDNWWGRRIPRLQVGELAADLKWEDPR
jgi:hypothetical protein